MNKTKMLNQPMLKEKKKFICFLWEGEFISY